MVYKEDDPLTATVAQTDDSEIILAFHLQNDPCYSTSQSSFNFTTLVTKHFCLWILFFIQSRVKNSTETIFIAWMSYTWRNPIFLTAQQQRSAVGVPGKKEAGIWKIWWELAGLLFWKLSIMNFLKNSWFSTGKVCIATINFASSHLSLPNFSLIVYASLISSM